MNEFKNNSNLIKFNDKKYHINLIDIFRNYPQIKNDLEIKQLIILGNQIYNMHVLFNERFKLNIGINLNIFDYTNAINNKYYNNKYIKGGGENEIVIRRDRKGSSSLKYLNYLVVIPQKLIGVISSFNDLSWRPYETFKFGVDSTIGEIPMFGSFMSSTMKFTFWMITIAWFILIYISISRYIGSFFYMDKKEVDAALLQSIQMSCHALSSFMDYIIEAIKTFDMPGASDVIESMYIGWKQMDDNNSLELRNKGIMAFVGNNAISQFRCTALSALPENLSFGSMFSLNLKEIFDKDDVCDTDINNVRNHEGPQTAITYLEELDLNIAENIDILTDEHDNMRITFTISKTKIKESPTWSLWGGKGRSNGKSKGQSKRKSKGQSKRRSKGRSKRRSNGKSKGQSKRRSNGKSKGQSKRKSKRKSNTQDIYIDIFKHIALLLILGSINIIVNISTKEFRTLINKQKL